MHAGLRSRRPIGLLAAATLILVGCARPVPVRPGATTVAADGSPSASAAGGAEATAVQSLVMSYLQADAGNDYQAMMSMTIKPIATYWSWYQQERGSCTCPPLALSVDHVRVTSVSDTAATVDLLATLRDEQGTTTITGPMRVVKTWGWYIADYSRDGADLAKSIAIRHGPDRSVAGVSVVVLGVDRDGRAEQVWMKITNGRSSDLALEGFPAQAEGITLQASSWPQGLADLWANNFGVAGIQWLSPYPMKPGIPLHIHLAFRDLSTGEEIAMDLSTGS